MASPTATLIMAGLLLAAGVPGRHAFTLTILPALLAASATLFVAALPRIVRSRPHVARWVGGIIGGVRDAEQTTFGHPSWRLGGALGYLGFDMAVMWIALHAAGEPLSIPALVLAYNIGYLANALPIPGGIGVLDAGLAGALLLYGASPAHVTAAVLVYHTVALWIPGLGGTLAYLRVRPRLIPHQPASVTSGEVPVSPDTEGNSMNSQALILRPTPHGWAIDRTGGSELARFRGPGAHARALRYLARISTTGDTLPTTPKPRPVSPEATC